MILVKGQKILDRTGIKTLKFFHLRHKDGLWPGGDIHRARLEHEDEIAAGLEITGTVRCSNLCLISLSYILIDPIDRLDKKGILLRPGGIGKYRHDVFAPL